MNNIVWRKYLNEASMAIDPRILRRIDMLSKLPEPIVITLDVDDTENDDGTWYKSATFAYGMRVGGGKVKSMGPGCGPLCRAVLNIGPVHNFDLPHGDVDIIRGNEHEDGPCDGAWRILSSFAKPGWGPLLYDLALEYASKNGGGLTADRWTVTSDAHGVWQKYLSRPDVAHDQLDIHQYHKLPQLTPDVPEDDCIMKSALSYSEEEGWHESPLAMRYVKHGTPVADMLRRMGRIIEEG